jgi:iron complex transport system permease protein
MFGFEKKNKNYKRLIIFSILIITSLFISIFSLKFGGEILQLKNLFTKENQMLTIHLRMPRIITDFMVGSSLSIVGFSFQTIVRNPLADPYLFGISGAAALGYILGVIFLGNLFLGPYLLSISLSVITIFLVFFISNKNHNEFSNLILIGVAISFFFSSIITVISVFLSDKFVKNILLWFMGDTTSLTLNESLISVTISIILSFIIFLDVDKLNICRMGESFAQTTGINVKNLIYRQYIIGSLITAIVVSKCGAIGFVGLAVPHIVRLIFKTNFRLQFILTFFIGGNLLVLLDTYIKTVFYPVEIPIGVITALLGSPFLIILLKGKKNDFG